MEALQLDAAGLLGGAGADIAFEALTGYSKADLAPAAVGGAVALGVGLLATPLTGALVASYAPGQPLKGAVLAVGLSFGLGLLAAGIAAAGVASVVAEGRP